MERMDIPQFEPNKMYYYFSEKVILLRIFEEIHMAKVRFLVSEKERIVDLGGIFTKPVVEISISIKLLGGETK